MAYSTQNNTSISVANLGIKLDGVTDNRVALQNAINSLYVVGGGTLFFPRGTCYWSGTVDVTGRNIRFEGENESCLLGHLDESAKKINVSGAKNIEFYGLTFNANRTGTNNSTNQNGFISTIDSTGISIMGCNLFNSRNSLIYLGGGTKFATISDNYFTGHFCGIFSYINSGEKNSQHFTITNNIFDKTWVGLGIAESACIKLQCQPSWEGFSNGHLVNNNVINSSLQMGIEIWSHGRNNIISNNTITNTDWGISLDNQEFCTVDSNNVKGVNYMGIECATACKNIVVSNNTINGYTGYPTNIVARYTQYGLSNSNIQCENLIYNGNIIEGCSYGINVQGSTNLIINSNIIRDNGINIFFQGGQNVQLQNNLFDTGNNSTSYHIFFDSSSRNITGYHISNNKFRGSTTDQSIFYYNNGNPYYTYNVCVENNVTDSTTAGGYGIFIGGQYTPYNYVYRNNFGPSGANAANSISDSADESVPYQTTAIENGYQYYNSSSWAIPASGITGNGIWVCVWSGGRGQQTNVRVSAKNTFSEVGNQYQATEILATMNPYAGFYNAHTLSATPFYGVNGVLPYLQRVKTLSHDTQANCSIWLKLAALNSGAAGQQFLFKYSQPNNLVSPYSTYQEPVDTQNNANLFLDNVFSNNTTSYKFSNGVSVGHDLSNLIHSSNSGVLNITTKSGVFIGTGTPTTVSAPLTFGNNLGNTIIALYDDVSNTVYGMGIQPNQLRFHVDSPFSKFSFLDGPNGNSVFTVQGDGKVGVATTNPTASLHVSGTLRTDIATSTTANVGAATLPANPVGFATINITGGNFKIPYYNI